MDTIGRFAYLFAGRRDAYGSDHGSAVWQPVTRDTFERHLTGVEPVGIYPVYHDGSETYVNWGCCDIDTGDWSEAYMLAQALDGMRLNAWVERSRSKGWHIWVFSNEPVLARDMRRCLKVAYAAIDLPAKEANPKSESLRPNQLGNYVRLPYKGGLIVASERQTMMDGFNHLNDGSPLSFSNFISINDLDLFSKADRIRHWASKWYEPPRRSINMVTDNDVDSIKLANSLPTTWRDVWLNGNVRDRSATFVAMAYDLAKRGWQAQDVYDILWSCPWNKYRDRNDGEYYVQDIVERAFS